MATLTPLAVELSGAAAATNSMFPAATATDSLWLGESGSEIRGFRYRGESALLRLGDAALDELVERTTLFAKTDPMQKARIVESVRRVGHAVGFLDDGVNDAPALRAADVGISGDTTADIARAADIILLEKDIKFSNKAPPKAIVRSGTFRSTSRWRRRRTFDRRSHSDPRATYSEIARSHRKRQRLNLLGCTTTVGHASTSPRPRPVTGAFGRVSSSVVWLDGTRQVDHRATRRRATRVDV
ncbi:hypothetical protein R4P64_32660 [Rhodococcus sp. IEGM 1366]|uniref:hypothetical protein n=1 Tax=Rhodococcus sp. IEGM 1366 TaxID=3082223 RepID=UPI00295591B5|nr:hypothetical protein [Rhodococcus sp. IEGM 1366]MDV8071269.1 hypothetical protein [Rhodococcus sp. IEGM 1366]